jgi:hypothetical protein
VSPLGQTATDELFEDLHDYPVIEHGLSTVLKQVAARNDLSVFIQGSIANGTMDPYSDIDLVFVTDGYLSLHEESRWLTQVMSSLGPLVAHFPATHLGMENLLIFFVDVAGDVVKVDVKLESLETFRAGPGAKALQLSDRMRAELRSEQDFALALPDFEDLHQKFAGWIWYTYTKIARGELFEAVDSMNVMRERALLPCLHLTAKIPREGYRRLETRLPREVVQQLRSTYPSGFEPRELCRALLSLSRMFRTLQPLLRDGLGRDHQVAKLDWMIAKLEKAQEELH